MMLSGGPASDKLLLFVISLLLRYKYSRCLSNNFQEPLLNLNIKLLAISFIYKEKYPLEIDSEFRINSVLIGMFCWSSSERELVIGRAK